jgi:hypothetical protein
MVSEQGGEFIVAWWSFIRTVIVAAAPHQCSNAPIADRSLVSLPEPTSPTKLAGMVSGCYFGTAGWVMPALADAVAPRTSGRQWHPDDQGIAPRRSPASQSSQPLPRNLAIQRRDRMSNRQDMMRHCRTSTNKPFGKPSTVTRGSAAVLFTVDDQNRYAIQTVCRVSPEWRQRSE